MEVEEIVSECEDRLNRYYPIENTKKKRSTKVNRVPRTCRKRSKGLTYMSSEAQKKRRVLGRKKI